MDEVQPTRPGPFVKERGVMPLTGTDLRYLGQDILTRNVPFRFRARGSSMRPFIRDGDVITVHPLAERGPTLGDVVAFIHPQAGNLVVHRLVGRQGSTWLTRGDGSSWHDGFVPANNLLGRVTEVERNGRRVRFGLGPERVAIALWRRRNWWRSLLRLFHRRLWRENTRSPF